MAERKHVIHSQLVSLVKENDWNFFLRMFVLFLVTRSAARDVGARALFLRRCVFPFLPLVGGFDASLGLDSPPEGFRPNIVLLASGRMVVDVNVGGIGSYVLIVERLEVPVLEKGTLGTEGSVRSSRCEMRGSTWNISISRAISLVPTEPPVILEDSS